MSSTFGQLLNSDSKQSVYLYADRMVNWVQIRKQVFLLRSRLIQSSHCNWILACHSTSSFLTGWLALIAANKEILLPPNNLVGTLNETIQGADAMLTDLEIETSLPEFRIPDFLDESAQAETIEYPELRIDAKQQFIQICTSGSTGEPKQIRKSLHTLESEINSLEKLWGDKLNDKHVVSTVSHQHIYGLLFRVLWPLMKGHVFVAENIEYPEQIHSLAGQLGELVLISSPAYLKRMADVLDKESMRSRVNVIYSSGGPLDHNTATFYTESYATTPIEVLGSTESGGIAHRQQRAGEDVFWQKFTDVQIKRQASNGALAIRSPYCFCDDWYEMGDAVELRSDSTFKLLERIDRIVKLEEKRISLDRMESVLGQHELIEQAKITLLSGHRTILGAACVLSEMGSSLLGELGRRAFSERLRDYLGNYFDRVTLPRKWRYVAGFPYNSQGKVTQADLVTLFDEEQND